MRFLRTIFKVVMGWWGSATLFTIFGFFWGAGTAYRVSDFNFSRGLFVVSGVALGLLLTSLAQRIHIRWLRRASLSAIPIVVIVYLMWTWYLVAEREAEKFKTSVAFPGAETMAAILAYGSVLRLLPWHWIFHGIAVAVLLAITILLLRERRRRQTACPEPLMHHYKLSDKDAITKWVRACFVRCEPHINVAGDERQFVDFRVCVLTLALPEISVTSVSGCITYIKEPGSYGEAVELKGVLELERNEKALNLGFRSEGWFTIRQYIPDYQLAIVAAGGDKSTFYFHNLQVMVTGEGFEPVRLDMPAQVQKGTTWTRDFEANFVFADIALLQTRIDYLQAKYDSRMRRIALLSETIGRANGLERVYQRPEDIPADALTDLFFVIRQILNECYGDQALNRFRPPGADAEFQIVQPDKYYDQTMWFLDYRKRLMELREDEQAALTNAIEADKK
jgi:hypothetical protein